MDQELAAGEFRTAIIFAKRRPADAQDFHPDNVIKPSAGAHHAANAYIHPGGLRSCAEWLLC